MIVVVPRDPVSPGGPQTSDRDRRGEGGSEGGGKVKIKTTTNGPLTPTRIFFHVFDLLRNNRLRRPKKFFVYKILPLLIKEVGTYFRP